MKINWFSPVPPDLTDIAHYTARIAPALENRFDLEIFSECPVPDLSTLPVNRVHPVADAIDWKYINGADHSVYHIGNNIHFHGQLMQLARKCPGIVVMHDLAVHETVLNWYLNYGSGRAGYYEELSKISGKEGIEIGTKFLNGEGVDANKLSEAIPFHQYPLCNPTGVITHNPMNVKKIREVTNAPVLFAPLPYFSKAALRKELNRTLEHRKPPYHIVFFGYLGSDNRRLIPFLKAFSKCSEKSKFRIHLAGKYDEQEIQASIKGMGIRSMVKYYGFVSEGELDALLGKADLAINLRWPSRGESSGTLLRTWNAALPTMLTRTAFYETVPNNSAIFVDPANEEEDILRHLYGFLNDPNSYYERGLNGYKRLKEEHSAEAFVKYFEEFLPAVSEYAGTVYPQMILPSITRRNLISYPDQSAVEGLLKKVSSESCKWLKL